VNLLAHFFLSQQSNELLFGNFIADGLPRSRFSQYSALVVEGIEHHHFIDTYTDTHDLVKSALLAIRPSQGKYAPVVLDILFDHFLAKYWEQFSSLSLEVFAQDVYSRLAKYRNEMTERKKITFKYMVEFNWLVAYASTEGLHRALKGMHRRAAFSSQMDSALNDLLPQFVYLEGLFQSFFPSLQKESSQYLLERNGMYPRKKHG
jgi:acyl carrier protein phosphodiesterase